jgi:hypothetical protein
MSIDNHAEPDDESGKACVINLRDARLAVAFPGLGGIPAFAGRPRFATRRWVAEALSEAAAPLPFMEPTMLNFRDIAERDIGQLQIPPGTDLTAKRANRRGRWISVLGGQHPPLVFQD